MWESDWVQHTTLEAATRGDPAAAQQLWLWLQREGWGLIPGVNAHLTLAFRA